MFNKSFFKYFIYLPTTRLQAMNIKRTLSLLKTTQHLPLDELYHLQEQSLVELVSYAKAHTLWYKDVPNVTTLNDLQKLPILTKVQIQDHINELTSTKTFRHITQKSTGGSTGTPLKLKHTNIVHERHLAAMWRGYSWAGVDMGDKRGHFWAVPPSTKKYLLSKIQDFVTNRQRYSAFIFKPEDLDRYIAKLNRFQPQHFYGYSSMLEKFALHLLEKNIRLNFAPQAIITTAEMLTENRREIIESTFNAPIFNEYGCGEVGTIAHECEAGSMHINAENLIVEVLDDDNNPKPEGEIGNVVVTLLHNNVMPIVRYKIGDLAALKGGTCSCGRTLPMMTPPIGRVLDYLKKKDGTTYYGNIVIHKLVNCLNSSSKAIHQIQIIQHDYDNFTFNIVPGKHYTQDVSSFLQKEVSTLFGDTAFTQVHLTNEIPRAPSGKLRNVICEV